MCGPKAKIQCYYAHLIMLEVCNCVQCCSVFSVKVVIPCYHFIHSWMLLDVTRMFHSTPHFLSFHKAGQHFEVIILQKQVQNNVVSLSIDDSFTLNCNVSVFSVVFATFDMYLQRTYCCCIYDKLVFVQSNHFSCGPFSLHRSFFLESWSRL